MVTPQNEEWERLLHGYGDDMTTKPKPAIALRGRHVQRNLRETLRFGLDWHMALVVMLAAIPPVISLAFTLWIIGLMK